MKNTLRLGLLASLAINAAALADNTQAHIAAFEKLNLDLKETAFILIDVQDDFTKANKYKSDDRKNVDGSLAVPNSGDEYIDEVTNFTRYIKNKKTVENKTIPVVASKDNHPPKHISFAVNNPNTKVFDLVKKIITTTDGTELEVNQVMWPAHCVQDTPGSDILVPKDLIDEVITKGERIQADSYSAFGDMGNYKTRLNPLLKTYGTKNLLVCGIATDYCVYASVTAAIENGYKVYVMLDLCRGVDDATSKAAIERMQALGAIIVRSEVAKAAA